MLELIPVPSPARLIAQSALGTADLQSSAPLFESEALRITEEPLLFALSLRSSRLGRSAEQAPLFAAWGLDASAGPNRLSGSAAVGSVQIEPQCWLLLSTTPRAVQAAPAGWLITEVSDRYAAFRLTGAAAVGVIAAGCDPAIVVPGRAARTRFGGMTTALIQRWSDTDVRILVDVSLGPVFAAWLRDTATIVTSR